MGSPEIVALPRFPYGWRIKVTVSLAAEEQAVTTQVEPGGLRAGVLH